MSDVTLTREPSFPRKERDSTDLPLNYQVVPEQTFPTVQLDHQPSAPGASTAQEDPKHVQGYFLPELQVVVPPLVEKQMAVTVSPI